MHYTSVLKQILNINLLEYLINKLIILFSILIKVIIILLYTSKDKIYILAHHLFTYYTYLSNMLFYI